MPGVSLTSNLCLPSGTVVPNRPLKAAKNSKCNHEDTKTRRTHEENQLIFFFVCSRLRGKKCCERATPRLKAEGRPPREKGNNQRSGHETRDRGKPTQRNDWADPTD